MGGDEFVILLDDICSLEDATYICDRLLIQFRLPIAIEDWTIALSLSIGVAFSSDDDYQNAGEILHHADLAMYSAKKQQQAAYELFQDNMLEAC